jgi:hypothetical protein
MMAFEFLLFMSTNTCLLHYYMTYSDDLVIVLLATAMLRLHKILNRVHNGKQLSNIDMTTLALLLTASLIHTHLMRIAVFTVLTYGCATWVCRWVVADAKRKDEEDAADDAAEDADTAPTPRSRSGSVVLHDDGNVTDPDMPPLIDADFANERPADEVDYKPAPITLEPCETTETVDLVARPPRGTTFPPIAIAETQPYTSEPGVLGTTVNEYISELSYQNALTGAVTEAEAAYQREGADVVNGATYPPAEEEKVFQALKNKYF